MASRHASGRVTGNNRTAISADQPANMKTPHHVDIDQSHIVYEGPTANCVEKADTTWVGQGHGPLDVQIGYGVSPAIEHSLKPVIAEPDGQPSVAGRPPGVDRAGGLADGVIEIQRTGQFIAIAIDADCSCAVVGKGGKVGFSPGFVVWRTVTIEIVADRV